MQQLLKLSLTVHRTSKFEVVSFNLINLRCCPTGLLESNAMGANHLAQLFSATRGKAMRQDRWKGIRGAMVAESLVATTAIMPAYKPAKRLATLLVMATALWGGIFSNVPITNVPLSRIKVVASASATGNSPQLRAVAESSAASCSSDSGPSTLHISEREAQSSLSWVSFWEARC